MPRGRSALASSDARDARCSSRSCCCRPAGADADSGAGCDDDSLSQPRPTQADVGDALNLHKIDPLGCPAMSSFVRLDLLPPLPRPPLHDSGPAGKGSVDRLRRRPIY